MALLRHQVNFPILTSEELEAWRQIPPAVASDCMNRTQVMHAEIKPVLPGLPICGQARTVTAMVGDALAICEAIAIARPGEILVVDANAVEHTAVWGGVMTLEAAVRKIGGVVIDGAVRDVVDIKASGLPVFCRAIVPRGPHHGFGGDIDAAASVAGVAINPGDIVLGNDDGVTVVPLSEASRVLSAAQEHLLKEQRWVEGLRSGKTIKEMFDMPDATLVE
jgi:regulator of RNase E activity RraA